ncbi:hypothetical protein BLA60_26835 [Actinophytocola xinjiangensis]|uniref:Excreted virulence factor EspC (Type VII ESX diderm) n=1 Tax=Actinophytocola xinjiangensis TaxID=485602 RepID=A0A7Z1AXB5_9PSEU|nr:type VII secretion target [Actinophytocola xinjiangensis]OLF07540.1 hypothetical protein BLA60_26835 [Actinophytocola xinjiangensis]
MPDGFFTVDTDEVRAHAGTVEEFGGRVDVAADAGAHLTTLDDAYGLACQPFAQMLVEPQAKGTESIATAAAKLHSFAAKLNDTATDYDECERRLVEVMEDLLESLEDAAASIPDVAGGN